MTDEHKPKRDPFDDAARMEVAPVDALCERMDWLRDQQIMLSVGTQGVISEAHKTAKRIESIASDIRWMRALMFLLLLWEVGERVMGSRPAQAMIAMVAP